MMMMIIIMYPGTVTTYVENQNDTHDSSCPVSSVNSTGHLKSKLLSIDLIQSKKVVQPHLHF